MKVICECDLMITNSFPVNTPLNVFDILNVLYITLIARRPEICNLDPTRNHI